MYLIQWLMSVHLVVPFTVQKLCSVAVTLWTGDCKKKNRFVELLRKSECEADINVFIRDDWVNTFYKLKWDWLIFLKTPQTMFLNSVRYKLSLLMTLILTLLNPCLRERQKTLRKKCKVFYASEFLLSLSSDCKTWPHDLKIKYSHLIGFGFVISPVAFLKKRPKKAEV